MSRVIRVDDDVFVELEQKAIGFDATPNSVIRGLLLMEPRVSRGSKADIGMLDGRVSRLMEIVESVIGMPPVVSPTKSNSYRFHSRSEKFVGYIYPQKERLKIECPDRYASEVRIEIDTCDHRVPMGFHNWSDSLYWYAPNGDTQAYKRVAETLAKLWEL